MQSTQRKENNIIIPRRIRCYICAPKTFTLCAGHIHIVIAVLSPRSVFEYNGRNLSTVKVGEAAYWNAPGTTKVELKCCLDKRRYSKEYIFVTDGPAVFENVSAVGTFRFRSDFEVVLNDK